MKADSKEVISELRAGGISWCVCTGDNTITGVSIGRQCGIISENARAPQTRPCQLLVTLKELMGFNGF